jgi:hypothetical protein
LTRQINRRLHALLQKPKAKRKNQARSHISYLQWWRRLFSGHAPSTFATVSFKCSTFVIDACSSTTGGTVKVKMCTRCTRINSDEII